MGDDWDEDALDLNDCELINLAPGQSISRSYTFAVGSKSLGYIHSDMYKLEIGKYYVLGLQPRRWRWGFTDDMQPDAVGGIAGTLNKKDVVEWKPGCTAVFEVVE